MMHGNVLCAQKTNLMVAALRLYYKVSPQLYIHTYMYVHVRIIIHFMLYLSPLIVFRPIHVHSQSLVNSFCSYLPTLNRFYSFAADSAHLFHCSWLSQTVSLLLRSINPTHLLPITHLPCRPSINHSVLLLISPFPTLFSSTVKTSTDRQ